jgi:hypothetical protein
MNRGTLMVLKRFLTMALGALGLGALAAGTAMGQTAGDGNIPAPDIFDDQITCSMNVPSMSPTPTVIPMGGMTSPLDDLIGMGNVVLTGQDGVDDLGYVIPPMGANCGAGGTDAFNAVTVGMGPTAPDANDATADYNPGEGDIATDVAHGYSELLGKFVAVYGDPGGTTGGTARALTAAQKALGDAIEAGRTGASLTPLEGAVERAQTAHDKARAAFTDASGGPVYQAGVAEWMAKAAVSKSIVDYDKTVVEANEARTELDGLSYANYVPLGNDELTATGTPVVTIAAGMASVNLNQLIQYANADLNNPQVATVAEDDENTEDRDETGVTTTTNSNFDAAGRLIVPMSLQDTDFDDTTDVVLASVKDAMNVSVVRTARDNTELAAAALEKLRDDNLNPALATVYSEAARRARVEADYYAGVYTAMLGDTTNLNGTTSDGVFTPTLDDANTPDVDESTPHSIASRNSEFQTEDNKRFIAEQTLRGAVAAREAATEGVRGAFNTPQSFYEQLVARRQALKVAADRKLASASEDGATPSETVTDAATLAAEQLVAAEEAQATAVAAFGDEDGPTAALVAELLKTGGDDGQALVDAIAATYETAAGAADAAREVVNELTGEGGAVAMNTTRSTDNADSIVELDGRVTQNEDDIAGNTTMIGENRTMIATNATNIATNSGLIVGLRTDVDSNTAAIGVNTGDILMNAGNIADNTTAIGVNSDAIASNMNSIGSNSSAISDNRNMIGELSESLEVVRAGVAASMALAGMPAINGRGISIGVGSFDGESAFAVGFQIQGEMASFKVGLTSGGGATGASAGVGFQF